MRTRSIRLLPTIVLLLPVCAWAAVTSPITRDGSCAAAATSCTLASPTPSVGDIVVTYAYRSTTTAPTLPASWTSIATASASGSSFRVGCQKLASGASSGAWTNATHVVSVAYKNIYGNSFTTANCGTIVIGGNAQNSAAASTTMTYSVLSLHDKSGLSWALAFGADLTVAPCTPSGTQAVTSIASAGTGPGVAAWDTNAGTTAWAAHTCSVASSSWRSFTFEIMADPCGTGNVYGGWSCVSYASSATNSVAFPSNTAGNLLVGCTMIVTASSATPTDANTNTWVAAGPSVLFSASSEQIQCWMVRNAKSTGSSNTVTFDPTPTTRGSFVAEFHNAGPADLDQSSSQANGTSNGATGAITAASLTPNSADELIVGAVNTSAGQFNKTGTIVGGDNPVLVGLGTENPILVFSTQASKSAIAINGIDSSTSDAYGWLQLSFSACSSSFFSLIGAGCR